MCSSLKILRHHPLISPICLDSARQPACSGIGDVEPAPAPDLRGAPGLRPTEADKLARLTFRPGVSSSEEAMAGVAKAFNQTFIEYGHTPPGYAHVGERVYEWWRSKS